MTRRQLLAGAGLLAAGGLAACDAAPDTPAPPGSATRSAPPTASPSAVATADAELRGAAADRTRVLLAAYDDVLEGRDDADPVRAPLQALRADHAAHLEELTGERPPAPPPDRPAGRSSPSTPGPTTQGPSTQGPSQPAPVPVEALLAAERLAQAGNAEAARTSPRELARLLASIAACQDSHEVVLGAVAAA